MQTWVSIQTLRNTLSLISTGRKSFHANRGVMEIAGHKTGEGWGEGEGEEQREGEGN